MTLNLRALTAALVILAAKTSFAEVSEEYADCAYLTETPGNPGSICGYMTCIPRLPTPILPDENFNGLTWSQRPLLPVKRERDDVCMDIYHVSNMQVIYMEESIEGDVAIAKLNYRGTYTPEIVLPFVHGSPLMLAPEIRKISENDGDWWYLVITNQQDFDVGMRSYTFRIRLNDPNESLSLVTVALTIVNIDDNDPIIEMVGPCEIAELGEPGVSECKYRVSDIDGRISTGFMTFEIDSDRGDEEVFQMKAENVTGEWGWLYMVLEVKQSLNFEESPLHIFRVTALDSLPNHHTVNMMVEVQNVESRVPRWVEIFSMQQYDEKQERSFRVRAIDGDTDINRQIHYRLEIPEEDKGLNLYKIEPIPEGGAWLNVAPIDRDTLEREIFELQIVAYKYGEDGKLYETPPHDITIIINDINDQTPLPFEKDGIYTITIPEETATTLNLENFGFHDRDLGPRAQYEVRLESVFPPGAHEAFYIAPERGYQRQSFIIGTQIHHMLDYEDEDYRKLIQIKAIATDMDDNTKVGVAIININLENWNDELPMFERTLPEISFKETVGKGFYVATVLAEDIDEDDEVEHSLMGNIDYLWINKTTGDIFVAVDDAFNYHRQSELIIQVRAEDTLRTRLDIEAERPQNTNTSQLVIHLEDVNNTPPTLRLPRRSPHVEENVPEGYVISQELIVATDLDTTAELRYEIDWESSYATKQGQETPTIEYHNCVRIDTLYPVNSTRTAYGRVVVREIRPNITIDYEMFEVLYLTVRVRDLNTVIGDDYAESTFTITIIDMNDNKPIWGHQQMEQEFRVREMSDTGVVIGSVFAIDIDGPMYNQVRYTIKPREKTPDDLVAINFETGQITVKKHQEIDADDPPRYNLYYTIIASDECSYVNQSACPPDKTVNRAYGDIAIQIIDTNNKVPRLETNEFNSVVYIHEGSPHGKEIVKIIASDLDRDLPHNNVSYQINYAVNQRLRDFFEVDLVTGMVRVHYTGADVLDRDGDEPRHSIFYNVIDNFLGERDGNRNQIEDQEILVILLDVNDNAPEMPDPSELPWTVSENEKEGFQVPMQIFAFDRDEPGSANSLVAYGILHLTTERDIDVPKLFDITTIETPQGIRQRGELVTAMDLQGYWGTYEINITAYDHGHLNNWDQLWSNETYQLVIRPYNFHDPVFVFPAPESTVRLSRERAMVNAILVTAGAEGAPLQHITATDDDGLHAGTVTFSIVGDDEAVNYFDMWNDGEDNTGTLILKQALPEGEQRFQLTIRATDGGDEPGPRSADSTVTVVFVSQGEPVFDHPNTDAVAFFEGQAGMEERYELQAATDPKNTLCEEGVDCHDIFYSIIGGNAGGHFALDGRWIYLLRQLDRSVSETHTLMVAASNTPGVTTALDASTLTVTVTVREASPRPHFVRQLFTAGISNDVNNNNMNLLTVQATHTEGLAITYTIDQESMVVDPTLESVQDTAFSLDPETGVLTRNIQPTISMHGMFEFNVVATDANGETDRAAVKVYLISSRVRVFLYFENTQQYTRDNQDFIAESFSTVYGMTCHVDDVVPDTDSNGIALESRTEVRAHFIQNDLPVPAEEFEELRSVVLLLRQVRILLETRGLELATLHTGDTPLAGGDYALAVYILAGLAGLFAVLSLVLLITFILRNRALNRRIAGLTKYNSVDSGLNNVGLAAPTPGTNLHAQEGSNPVYNARINAPDFDAISEVSNDSDLIGIEDLPQFRTDYFPPELAESMRTHDDEEPGMVPVMSARNPIANHENNFGFNTTPFSPEFVNTQLRK